MCIGEAIIRMMKTTDFHKLKISEIVKVAGVARMTFYKYYDSPYAALTDYLGMITTEYMECSMESQNRAGYMSYEHILYSLKFFDQYADFFLTLDAQGLYSIMQNGINHFMENHILTSRKLSVYELYAYSGSLLNTFVQWEKRGKKESVEEIAGCMYHLYNFNETEKSDS